MNRQSGFTLIELILSVGLAAFATMLAFQSETLDLDQAKARITGNQLTQYNNAVAAWAANNYGAASATYTGTAWLKSTTCPGGLSPIAYLPCTFPAADAANPLPGGQLNLVAAITSTGSAPNQLTTITTTSSPYIIRVGQVRADLAGLAGFVAQAAPINNSPAVSSTNRRVVTNISSGVITLITTVNGQNNAWLRTDGGNTMNANIKYNNTSGATMRELQNVSRVQALAAEALTLGNPGGAASGYSVVVDANEIILGNLAVQNAGNAATSVTLTKGSIRTRAGNISTPNQAIAGNVAIGQALIDTDDTAYYADPTGTSVLNRAIFNNGLTTGQVIDLNDGNYKAIPSGTSTLWQPSTFSTTVYGNTNIFGTLDTAEFFEMPNTAVRGAACAPAGTISTEASGAFVVCKGGVWSRSYYDDTSIYTVETNPAPAGERYVYIGQHRFCAIAGMSGSGGKSEAHCSVSTNGADGWWISERTTLSSSINHWCQASCLDN
ncbi:type IV pilus modification PilV family protein [Pseudomonas aeruginosa]